VRRELGVTRFGVRVLLAVLLTVTVAGALRAQAAEPALVLAGDTAVAAAKREEAPLPPWRSNPPAVVRSVVEITFINAVAAGINTLARDIQSPSPGTWWDNIQGGWEWDPNDIRVNHFEHPWAGAAYFNVGRANGLSFWGAAPMAFTGSLMWELLGEAKPPSVNDLMSTTITGISMGEPLRRLSLMVLDEEARGVDRVWREVAVFVANPGLGLNRLSRGQSWQRRQNMPGRRPDALRTGLVAGARQLGRGDGRDPLTSALAGFSVEYGDPFAGGAREPFSSFSGSLELLSSSPDALGQMSARGLLVGLGDDAPRTSVGGVFMDFDYRRDGVVDFAQQSFGLGLLSRSPMGGDFRLVTDVSLEATPILAVRDGYSEPLTERTYDYGIGGGGRALAQLEHRGRRVLSASYRAYWGATLNGASDSKLVQLAAVEARLPVVAGFALGASYQLFLQRSTYNDRPAESQSLPAFSVYVARGY